MICIGLHCLVKNYQEIKIIAAVQQWVRARNFEEREHHYNRMRMKSIGVILEDPWAELSEHDIPLNPEIMSPINTAQCLISILHLPGLEHSPKCIFEHFIHDFILLHCLIFQELRFRSFVASVDITIYSRSPSLRWEEVGLMFSLWKTEWWTS